jgi:hypothetical protein
MAVDEQIRISLIGDGGNLTKTLQQLQAQLRRFQEGIRTATNIDSLERLQRAAAATQARIAALASAPTSAASGLGNLSRASNTSTQSLINLSRVAQDAPYGLIGIANNLNPLLESLQRGARESGGFGNSLKALGSAMLGPAGIGLALGVVSALLIKYRDKLFSSGNAAKEHAKKLEDAKKKLDEYIQSLDDVTRSSVQGAQAAQEQLVTLQTLYTATQNANIPLADRKKLVDQLQEQYPKYFGNIKDEIILAGGAADAYNKLTTAILASSRAEAAKATLVDLQKQILAAEENTVGALRDQTSALKKVNDLKNSGKKTTETSLTGEERLTETGATLNKLQNDLADKSKKVNEAYKERIALSERAKKMAEEVNSIVEANPNALLKPTGKPLETKVKEVKVKPEKITIERTGTIQFDSPTDFFKNLNLEEAQKSNPDYEKFLRNQFSNIKIPLRLNIVPPTTPLINAKDLHIIDGIALAAKANEEISRALSSIETAGFASLGDAIGKAISGGNLTEAFAALGGQLGSVITQLGEQMISLGVIALATKKAIASFFTNPFALIAAGVALTAFGSVIQSKLSVPHLAEGGIIPPGYNGDKFPAMLNSGEAVIPLNKIHSILGNTGNSGPQVIVMAQRLRGRDAVLQQVREGKSQRRAV